MEPLRGWRHVDVTARRTNVDFAQQMRALVDVHCPDADRIRVVLDNLSCHTGAALYEAFEATEARRILRKLEFHYTPKHGSWLNMAEIEISILGRQAFTAASTAPSGCRNRPSHGRPLVTPPAHQPRGASPSPTPGSNSTAFTHHDHCGEELGRMPRCYAPALTNPGTQGMQA